MYLNETVLWTNLPRSMITIRTWLGCFSRHPRFRGNFSKLPMSKIFFIFVCLLKNIVEEFQEFFYFVDDKKSKNHHRRETCPLIYDSVTFQIWKTHDTDAHHIPERNQRSDTFLLRELLDVSRVRIYRRDCRGRYLQRWIYFR